MWHRWQLLANITPWIEDSKGSTFSLEGCLQWIMQDVQHGREVGVGQRQASAYRSKGVLMGR